MDKSGDSKYYNARVKLQAMRRSQSLLYEQSRDYIPGVVFTIGGSYYADRSSNYVWVHENGSPASQAQAYLPPHLNVFAGAGVVMMRAPKDPYEFEIVRVHMSPYPRAVIEANASFGRVQYGVHGPNHQYPTEATVGPDPVLIWSPALQNLKSVGNGADMVVTVGPLYYGDRTSRGYYPTDVTPQTIDLTPYIPSSGMRRHVLIYLDTETGALAVMSGAEQAAVPEYPDTPQAGIASAYFLLTDSHTVIDMAVDYIEARRFLTESGGGSTGSATEPGQMLFSDDDLFWVPGYLLMDPDTNDLLYDPDTGDLVWSD